MGESVAAWDAEVGNAPVVEGVPFGGSLKSFLILEDAVLKTLDLFREAMELHRRIGLVVGNGGEETVCNGAKEHRVNVVVGSESQLNRPR